MEASEECERHKAQDTQEDVDHAKKYIEQGHFGGKGSEAHKAAVVGDTVANRDLWEELLAALEPHEVTFTWIKGHAGHAENERCDALATAAADGDGLLVDEGYVAG